MRAILIDPTERTVSEVDVDGGYQSIQKAIGVDLFTLAGNLDRNDLYVDDEGLLKAPTAFFHLLGCYPTPLAGKGLLLGRRETEDGVDSGPCTLDLEVVRSLTTFMQGSADPGPRGWRFQAA